ncbi:hypothetical protein [Prochlorococcus marinus]|uniref:hypothetical protein n=1 Tax=Prochlorococcus marinus TaxID=1219 RepID=UPI001F42E190|nr:hypothetical protein [Prochlorococcus marinus]
MSTCGWAACPWRQLWHRSITHGRDKTQGGMSINARSFVLARVLALAAACLGPMFRAMAYLYLLLGFGLAGESHRLDG